MKKSINKLNLTLLFMFISLLFFAPVKVEAVSYKSDFVNLEDTVEFSTDKFIIDLKYTEFDNGTSEKPLVITGETVRKNDDIYYYHYIIYYYNLDKKEIGATDGYNGIWTQFNSTPTEPTDGFFISYLEQSSMYDGYELKDIKYYKIFIEQSTKEIAYNYLYNNTKLNPNGLDAITDFNTVEMVATPLIDVNDNYNDYSSYSSNSGYFLNSYAIAF